MRDAIHAARFVIGFAAGADRRRTAIGVGLIFLGHLGPPGAALLAKQVVDAALAHDRGAATAYAAALGATWLAMMMARHFAVMYCYELADLVAIAFDERVMELANDSPGIEHHERPDVADRLALLREEAAGIWQELDTIVDTFAFSAQVAFTAALLATVSPILLLLPLFGLPALAAGRRAQDVVERARMATAERDRLARHFFLLGTDAGAGKEIRLFRLRDELRRRQSEAWTDVAETRWAAQRGTLLLRALGQLVFAAGYVGALALVSVQAVRGHTTLGDVLLTVVLVGRVNQQVGRAVSIADTMRSVARTVGRYEWLRGVTARPAAQATTPVPERLERGLSLRDVRFAYPGTDVTVLDRVSLDIPAGTTLAIVGENGAGKTTLVKLLCRFYEPTSGSIMVDGAALASLPLEGWRARIAAVFQDFLRLEARVRETVGVGDVGRIEQGAAVAVAVDRAGAEPVVERLPERLETQLGKSYADGVEPSGGEWQRLALARALMRDDPLLLVLDEPSSALDAEAEHALFSRYTESARDSRERAGAITVFTSHRFSTVRMADLIVVLREGSIVEVGSHAELVARGGLYAELYELQARAYR